MAFGFQSPVLCIFSCMLLFSFLIFLYGIAMLPLLPALVYPVPPDYFPPYFNPSPEPDSQSTLPILLYWWPFDLQLSPIFPGNRVVSGSRSSCMFVTDRGFASNASAILVHQAYFTSSTGALKRPPPQLAQKTQLFLRY